MWTDVFVDHGQRRKVSEQHLTGKKKELSSWQLQLSQHYRVSRCRKSLSIHMAWLWHGPRSAGRAKDAQTLDLSYWEGTTVNARPYDLT